MSSKDIPSESKIDCTLCPSYRRLRTMREHYSEKHNKGVLTIKCTVDGSCYWDWFCAKNFECFIEHVKKEHPNFKIDGCSTQFKPENGFEFVEFPIDYIEHSKICCVIKELHEDAAMEKRDALRKTKNLAAAIIRANKKRKISEIDNSKEQMKPKKKILKRDIIKNIGGFCLDVIMELVDVLVDAVEETIEVLEEVTVYVQEPEPEVTIVEEIAPIVLEDSVADDKADLDEDIEDYDEDIGDVDELELFELDELVLQLSSEKELADEIEAFEIVSEIITLEPDDEIKPVKLVDKTEAIEIIDVVEEIEVIESDDAIKEIEIIEADDVIEEIEIIEPVVAITPVLNPFFDI